VTNSSWELCGGRYRYLVPCVRCLRLACEVHMISSLFCYSFVTASAAPQDPNTRAHTNSESESESTESESRNYCCCDSATTLLRLCYLSLPLLSTPFSPSSRAACYSWTLHTHEKPPLALHLYKLPACCTFSSSALSVLHTPLPSTYPPAIPD